jgi:NAD-dependent SIR2 family protein deacetylase
MRGGAGQAVRNKQLTTAGKTGLLRPAVIWFGENLDPQTLKRINQYLSRPHQDPVDLCIVIGTSGTVFPTAGYDRQLFTCTLQADDEKIGTLAK